MLKESATEGSVMSIKTRELKPNKENLILTLQYDLIDRNAFVTRFVLLLNSIDDSFSIAIDGDWGDGKTFFVKQAKLVLDACNLSYSNGLSDSEKDTLRSIITGMNSVNVEEIKPQLCCYYDAWINDNDIDPLLSIVYSISMDVCEGFPGVSKKDIKNKLAAIADAFTGRDTKSVVDAFRSEDPFTQIKRQKALEGAIKEFFDLILAERGERLILFVDELDRCNPDFAVLLLERIKHYFDNERITFVFSTNIKELQHSIKMHYGFQFDACRYLDRFFDAIISLPEANMEKYLLSIGVKNNYYSFDQVCRLVVNELHFSMREAEHYYKVAYTCAYKVTHVNNTWDSARAHGISFANMVIVPVVLGLKMRNIGQYYDFINGKSGDSLFEILQDTDLAYRICDYLLSYNESFESKQPEILHVNFRDRLQMAYDAIFNNNNNEDTIVGRCAFTSYTKKHMLTLISMLTVDSSY